jgi:hypothetical protein
LRGQNGNESGDGIRAARKVKITAIAARLRKVVVDMEIKAALDRDLDFPDELVLPFITNALTDKRMLEERPAAAPHESP